MFSEYACAVFGIPQALLGMANALAAALPCRKGPPNGPAALRVSAMRQGVTGTKRKPVSAASPIRVMDSVLPVPPFKEVIAGAGPVESGVVVGKGVGAGVELAEDSSGDVDVCLISPTLPPHPAKENTMRDKQISERFPESQNESWRRIDYLSAI